VGSAKEEVLVAYATAAYVHKECILPVIPLSSWAVRSRRTSRTQNYSRRYSSVEGSRPWEVLGKTGGRLFSPANPVCLWSSSEPVLKSANCC